MWCELCEVYDGSGTENGEKLKIYMGGVSQTLTFSGNIPTQTEDMGSEPFVIGRYRPDQSQFWNGSIDEVAIWNRSLSSNEISLLYKAGIGKYGTELLNNFSKKNDNITVEVTPIDYLDWGTAVNSSLITILDTYTTWSNNGTNFTSIKANENGMFNVTVNDADELDRCIFSLRNDTSLNWYNYSALDVSGTSYELRYNITISTRRNETLSWRYYCNDSSGTMYNSSENSITISNTAPAISSVQINSTNPALNNTLQNITSHIVSPSDADNDNISYAYRWFNQSGIIAQSPYLDNNLVFYFPFDNDNLDYAYALGNDSTIFGDFVINKTDAKIGNGAAYYNGKGYVTTSSNYNYGYNISYTISAWFKRNASEQDGGIVSGSGAQGNNFVFNIGFTGSPR